MPTFQEYHVDLKQTNKQRKKKQINKQKPKLQRKTLGMIPLTRVYK